MELAYKIQEAFEDINLKSAFEFFIDNYMTERRLKRGNPKLRLIPENVIKIAVIQDCSFSGESADYIAPAEEWEIPYRPITGIQTEVELKNNEVYSFLSVGLESEINNEFLEKMPKKLFGIEIRYQPPALIE